MTIDSIELMVLTEGKRASVRKVSSPRGPLFACGHMRSSKWGHAQIISSPCAPCMGQEVGEV